jgi:hypothetical protein
MNRFSFFLRFGLLLFSSPFKAGLPDGLGIFKPKIQIWEYFEGPWNVKCCHIL